MKPTYILSGVLAEVLLSVPGHGDFSPKNNVVCDPDRKSFEVWGTRRETWHWTSERDTADFAADIVGKNETAEDGFWSVCSGEHTLEGIAEVYEAMKAARLRSTSEELLMNSEKELCGCGRMVRGNGFWEYIGWFYQLHTVGRNYVLCGLDDYCEFH